MTRALATATEREQVLELVRERTALRREFEALKGTAERPEERVA